MSKIAKKVSRTIVRTGHHGKSITGYNQWSVTGDYGTAISSAGGMGGQAQTGLGGYISIAWLDEDGVVRKTTGYAVTDIEMDTLYKVDNRGNFIKAEFAEFANVHMGS